MAAHVNKAAIPDKTKYCLLCNQKVTNNYRNILSDTHKHLHKQVTDIIGVSVSKENWSKFELSSYTCVSCYCKLNKLNKIDYELSTKIESLRQQKKDIQAALSANKITVNITQTPTKKAQKRQLIKTPTPKKLVKRSLLKTPQKCTPILPKPSENDLAKPLTPNVPPFQVTPDTAITPSLLVTPVRPQCVKLPHQQAKTYESKLVQCGNAVVDSPGTIKVTELFSYHVIILSNVTLRYIILCMCTAMFGELYYSIMTI